MKKLLCLLFVLCLICAGCSKQQNDTLKVGVIKGLGDEIMQEVQKNGQQQGFAFEIIVFEDYTEINTALKQKALDLNCFQNAYWLEQVNKERQTDFIAVGRTYLSPLGAYAQKQTNFASSSTVAIPSDVISTARALIMLKQAGYLKLKDTGTFLPGLEDIEENIAGFVLTPVDTASIRASLGDYDVVFLGLNYALSSGLQPRDALLLEQPPTAFDQLLVTRSELKNDPAVLQFVKLYNSEQTKKFILEKYADNLLPAW